MNKDFDLKRFTAAQEADYATALSEIKRGRKRSHWMWYIFPQVQGLGLSATSRFYGIHDVEEAAAYLAHPVLGARLLAISNVLLQLDTADAHQVFGSPDDKKLQSCMTLFSILPVTDPVFQQVLDKYFNGAKDRRTIEIIAEKTNG